MGIVVPGLGLLVDWGTRGFQAVQNKRAEEKALARTIDLGAAAASEQHSAAEDVAKTILAHGVSIGAGGRRRRGHSSHGPGVRGIPAGPADLQPGAAGPDRGHRVARSPRPRRLTAWRDTAAAAGQLDVVDVPDLPASDLREFVTIAAPNVDHADANRLVGHYPNPLALQLFLGLASTQKRITRNDGGLPISVGELAGLPREDVRDLYRAMWLELPEPVRRVSTLAAGVLPPHTDLTWPFLPPDYTPLGPSLPTRSRLVLTSARLTKTARETLSVPHVGMPA